MQIGISKLAAPDLSMAAFFAESAEAGYEVVEICMKQTGELVQDTSPDELQRIVDLSAAHNLPIVSMTHNHCTGNLLASGDDQRLGIDQTLAGLHAAKAMHIDCTLHTLGWLSAELFYDEAYDNGVQSLKEIATTCAALEVHLAIEFVWNGFLFSPLEMKQFIEDVGSEYIGFYFDPGNMAVFNFPQHWARILGAHIKLVHMKDWQGRALNGSWPALLEGEVDFAAVNRELRAAGYDGPMLSEVPLETASLTETADAIRKIIAM